MIIHLNGWPGVGKKTIGSILAERLGARFIHNHLLHDVAIACTGFSDPRRWELYNQIREATYTALADRPSGEIFVMTNALCATSPREIEAWSHIVDLSMIRNSALVPVVLEATFNENARRLQSEERIGHKMTDVDQLLSDQATETLQRPGVPELLTLNVTSLSPKAAALQIESHLEGLGTSLLRAGPRHLQLNNALTREGV